MLPMYLDPAYLRVNRSFVPPSISVSSAILTFRC